MTKHKQHLLYTVLALAALAGTFVLYTQPDFMLRLSNQIWACF